MIRWVAYLATVALGISTASAPSLSPIDRLTAPGHLVGAVFTDMDQIVALSSDGANQTTGEQHCSLSAWDIQQKKWTVSKIIDTLPPSFPCGSVAYLPLSHNLAVSRAGILLLVDPHTLSVERKISVEPYDIAAVSEENNIVYALSRRGTRPLILTNYYLSTGNLAQKYELPELSYGADISTAVVVTSKKQTIFVQSDLNPITAPKKNSTITLCMQEDRMMCKTVTANLPIATFRTSGDSLLFVSGEFADRRPKSRNQCIERMSDSTLQIDTRAYCRPDAGVHYSLATLGSDLVLGYSGYGAYYAWLDGLMVNKSSSISVWDAKSGRLVAVAPLPYGKSFTLTASVIQADISEKKRFLFYNAQEGSQILLYDLSQLPHFSAHGITQHSNR
jgi:hypothetical protein